MAIIERSVSVSWSIGFSVWGLVQRSIQVSTRPPAVSLRPRFSSPASITAAKARPRSFTSSLIRTRPISIITHEAKKTSTADEVWAGKITTQESRTGARMGHVPSRQILRWSGRFHRSGLSEGMIRSLSITLCRPASCRARNSTVATLSASEGWNWKGPSGIQRAAPLVVAPMK